MPRGTWTAADIEAEVQAHGRRWRNRRTEQSTMVRSVHGEFVQVSDVASGRTRNVRVATFLDNYEPEDA